VADGGGKAVTIAFESDRGAGNCPASRRDSAPGVGTAAATLHDVRKRSCALGADFHARYRNRLSAMSERTGRMVAGFGCANGRQRLAHGGRDAAAAHTGRPRATR
jgi:hypothetical protein